MNLRKECREDRAISQEALDAIANYNGPITVCPPCKHAIDYAELEIERRKSGENGWKSGKQASHNARERQLKFQRAQKVANAPAKPDAPKRLRISDEAFLAHIQTDWIRRKDVSEATGLSGSATRKRLVKLEAQGIIERSHVAKNQPEMWRRIKA